MARNYLRKGVSVDQKALKVAESLAVKSRGANQKGFREQAPNLKAAMELLAQIFEARHKTSEAQVFKSKAASLAKAIPPKNLTTDLHVNTNRIFFVVRRPSSFLKHSCYFESAYNAIQNKKVDVSIQKIARLKRTYEQEIDFDEFLRRPLNSFCALLSLSRLLADHGRIPEAQAILGYLEAAATGKELTTPVVKILTVEKALNDSKLKKSLSTWAKVDEEKLSNSKGQ